MQVLTETSWRSSWRTDGIHGEMRYVSFLGIASYSNASFPMAQCICNQRNWQQHPSAQTKGVGTLWISTIFDVSGCELIIFHKPETLRGHLRCHLLNHWFWEENAITSCTSEFAITSSEIHQTSSTSLKKTHFPNKPNPSGCGRIQHQSWVPQLWPDRQKKNKT